MTTKVTYRAALIAALEAKGVTVDTKTLTSAMGKVVRQMKGKFCEIDWACEFEEAGVGNGVFAYEESAAGTVDTYNRAVQKNFRKAPRFPRGW